MSEPELQDVLIVGGGLAGLAVARGLQAAEVDFQLLEGRAEFGGRIRSGPAAGLDLGPSWCWPHQSRIQRLASELGLELFQQQTRGDVLFQVDAQNTPMRRPYPEDGMVSLRVRGGVGRLVETLLEEVDASRLHSDQTVHGVQRSQGLWQVSTRSTEGTTTLRRARHLVLALPPRLIVRDLQPEGWASDQLVRDLSAQQTWMGGQAKFVARYDAPFWREDGLSGQAMSAVGPLAEVHDASQVDADGPFALFGFVGAPAERRKAAGPPRVEAACLRQLVDLFGPRAQRPIETALMDWAAERFASTEQDAGESSRHAEFPMARHADELRGLDLSLAGSEFAIEEPGYLEGALEAAEAVTRTILADR